ncbi:MAG: hypothetical protein OEY43_03885 [Gammaproteobacteria bacterium]|nr:hypothetical protein [Gammaproteobacteria bacterium]
MSELFKRFSNICLLSGGPQDLPCSYFLFRVLLIAYLLSSMAGWSTELEIAQALLAAMVDGFIVLVYVYAVLQGFTKSARFLQTASAILAVGILFQLLELPLLFFLVDQGQHAVPMEVSLLLLALYSWNLAIYAHILRQALETTTLVSFVLTICYVFIAMTTYQLIFPDLGA